MSTSDSAFKVTHESLHQAANVLPDNVSALGDTRGTLLSRTVPASASSFLDTAQKKGEKVSDGFADWARNVQSGHIGDHYEKEVADILAKPPTNENLRNLAETETKFWKSDNGSTVGGWFSADWRYDKLVAARTDWLAGMPPDEAAAIRQQLGLPPN